MVVVVVSDQAVLDLAVSLRDRLETQAKIERVEIVRAARDTSEEDLVAQQIRPGHVLLVVRRDADGILVMPYDSTGSPRGAWTSSSAEPPEPESESESVEHPDHLAADSMSPPSAFERRRDISRRLEGALIGTAAATGTALFTGLVLQWLVAYRRTQVDMDCDPTFYEPQECEASETKLSRAETGRTVVFSLAGAAAAGVLATGIALAVHRRRRTNVTAHGSGLLIRF